VDDAPRLRRLWIDNLKLLLIALIIAMHGVLSYAGTLEVWTYSEFREVTLSPVTEGVLLVLVTPFGFLMIPLLFLVAGGLTPGSLHRKGVRRFVGDRLLRLGLPYVVFAFGLQPALSYALGHPLGDAPGSYAEEYLGAERQVDSGPLWFVGVLLLFSLVYAGWVWLGARWSFSRPRPITGKDLAALTAAVAVASFGVRLVAPYASEAGFFDLNPWEWPGCAAAFGLGIVTARYGWLDEVPGTISRDCRRAAFGALAAMAGLLIAAGSRGQVEAGLGGWNWWALGFAAIEAPLVICGPVWLLTVARRRLDRQSRWTPVLARSSYPAFIVQGFVLIGIAALLRGVDLPAEVKAVVVAAGGVAGSFLLGWLLLQIPGMRRVL
jgi:hypothetical protein